MYGLDKSGSGDVPTLWRCNTVTNVSRSIAPLSGSHAIQKPQAANSKNSIFTGGQLCTDTCEYVGVMASGFWKTLSKTSRRTSTGANRKRCLMWPYTFTCWWIVASTISHSGKSRPGYFADQQNRDHLQRRLEERAPRYWSQL